MKNTIYILRIPHKVPVSVCVFATQKNLVSFRPKKILFWPKLQTVFHSQYTKLKTQQEVNAVDEEHGSSCVCNLHFIRAENHKLSG